MATTPLSLLLAQAGRTCGHGNAANDKPNQKEAIDQLFFAFCRWMLTFEDRGRDNARITLLNSFPKKKDETMKARSLLVAAVSVAMLTAALYAVDESKLEGIKCPVSGRPVKAGTGVAYKGGEVYFCCQNCPNAFKGNTAKFAAKANQQLVATGQAKQVKCPLTGRVINPATAIDVAGSSVAFCCNNCKGKVAAAQGADQTELVFSDKAFDKAFEVKKDQ